MGRVVRTSLARRDVLGIWKYIAEDNPSAADKLITRFTKIIQHLSDQPKLGSPQDKFRLGLRCMPVGNYLIFYEPIVDGIRVIRILHSARSWEDLIS